MSDQTLAIDGGTPVRTEPMPARALFGEAEKAAAMAVFDEAIAAGGAFGYAGPHEQAYEAAFAGTLGGGFAKGVNSGTSAVLTALAALELEPGSEVVVPPISDPGGVMPVAMLNCVPVAADGNGFSFNMGPEQIEAEITERTKAIIVAHIMGEPADMPGICELARQRGVPVIEDAAQAHMAAVGGKPVGTWGDITAFSTMSGKHHATGAQGGVVFTADEELFWRARRFMDRGKPFGTDDSNGNVRLGLNLNSNELSAAIGLVQLRKLPGMIARRRAIAEALFAGLADLQAVRAPRLIDGAVATYWFIRLTADESRLSVDKTTFAEAVAAEGIPVTPSYGHLPSHHAWFKQRRTYGTSGYPWPDGAAGAGATIDLPNAGATIAESFLIVAHENWTDGEVKDTLAALGKVEAAYLKS